MLQLLSIYCRHVWRLILAVVAILFCWKEIEAGELTKDQILNSLVARKPPTTVRRLTKQELEAELKNTRKQQVALLEQSTLTPSQIERLLSVAGGSGNGSVNLQIQFSRGSSEIEEDSERQLMRLGEALTSNELKGRQFVIAGYTDAIGSENDNLSLSQSRAWAVMQFLEREFSDLADDRLTAIGFGEQFPIDNDDPDNPENRRVQIIDVGVP